MLSVFGRKCTAEMTESVRILKLISTALLTLYLMTQTWINHYI